MFAYCNNSPVIYFDFTGTRCVINSCILDPVNGGTALYTNNSSEVDKDNTPVIGVKEKIEKSALAVINNVVIDAGIGLGLYRSDAVGPMEWGLGLYYDVCHITVANGCVYIREYANMEASATVASIIRIGHSDIQYREYSSMQWEADNSEEALSIIGGGTYLYGGGNINVGFKINSFLDEIDYIWGLR